MEVSVPKDDNNKNQINRSWNDLNKEGKLDANEKYTIPFLFFFHLSLNGQNPITQETSYHYTAENTWRKVSTVDYDYQGDA